MNYSYLAETVKISKICFGCEPLGGIDWGEINVNDIALAINRGIDLGVNFFDTADVYGLGLSEERLSEILGARRHDVAIATKGGVSWARSNNHSRAVISMNSSPKYIRRAVESSLQRLRVDHLPIYYVHWPDPKTDIRVTFDQLEKLKSEKKIGLIGCSNYNAHQLALAAEVAEVSIIQLPLNVLSGPVDKNILKICIDNNVKIIAYNVLASGLLTGKYSELSKFNASDRRSRLPHFSGEKYLEVLTEIKKIEVEAKKNRMTLGQYAISWVLKQEQVSAAITGVKTVSQIEQNIRGV